VVVVSLLLEVLYRDGECGSRLIGEVEVVRDDEPIGG
jgi:hypothetical protein